jgi:hypothetical protein
LVSPDDNSSERFHSPTASVKPSKTLAERVEASAFGDKRIEVKICTDFEGLRGDDEDWPGERAWLGRGTEFWQPSFCKLVAVEGAHPTGE